ncbi:MAG: hypothetical protein A2782_01480 [Candidatus Blackburnbacteria bacterium RIFCSPHIGHO2_01_FULL_43_15b]|uniref:Uncharacterized protein n=1 Tax=Candidatus Blackburnbacteria bacterium RIFCSPHIGHO2_01_FULL_43_15b TaxID=1797513 RepID=A0A1G1UXG8_9BACT|nr:MAG: hypothetical protein A2782_01480 [Candidatus Blackburnbacteria bacterium RIFCSPHIGHO2_01_FULL_43_15b]
MPNLIVAQAEITPDLPIAIAPKFLEMFWDRNQGKLFLNATSARHVSAHLLTIVADEKLAEQVATILHMEDKGLSNDRRWWRFDTVLKLYVPNATTIPRWKHTQEAGGTPTRCLGHQTHPCGFQSPGEQVHFFRKASDVSSLEEVIRDTAIFIRHRDSPEEPWFAL